MPEPLPGQGPEGRAKRGEDPRRGGGADRVLLPLPGGARQRGRRRRTEDPGDEDGAADGGFPGLLRGRRHDPARGEGREQLRGPHRGREHGQRRLHGGAGAGRGEPAQAASHRRLRSGEPDAAGRARPAGGTGALPGDGPERRGHHQGRGGAGDRPPGLRRQGPHLERLRRRRHPRHADRLDGLFALSGRPDRGADGGEHHHDPHQRTHPPGEGDGAEQGAADRRHRPQAEPQDGLSLRGRGEGVQALRGRHGGGRAVPAVPVPGEAVGQELLERRSRA